MAIPNLTTAFLGEDLALEVVVAGKGSSNERCVRSCGAKNAGFMILR